MRAVPLRAALLAAALALGVAAPAAAEWGQDQGVRGSLDARLNPSRLPRERPAPIAVRVAGTFRPAHGSLDQLPQLRRIKVGINREGRLFDRGLPVCRAAQIQPASEDAARKICGGAIVGSGHVDLQVRIPDQTPYSIRSHLLAFNGPRRDGHRLILAQAYFAAPPSSFVISFEVRHRAGVFGTVLSTKLPRAARRWAWLTHFDLMLHRSFDYRGERRSYVSAACPVPDGGSSAFFPFARALYSFAGGADVEVEASRSCSVAEQARTARGGAQAGVATAASKISREGIPITSPWKRLRVP